MEVPLLKDIAKQLLQAPVDPKGTLADVVTYVRTLLSVTRRLVDAKEKEAEKAVLDAVKACFHCMLETEVETAGQIAPFLATSLAMLKSFLATTKESTRAELLEVVPSVMDKPVELIDVVLVAVSSIIQCCGATKPELLKPIVQALPQLSKKYQQYVMMIVNDANC